METLILVSSLPHTLHTWNSVTVLWKQTKLLDRLFPDQNNIYTMYLFVIGLWLIKHVHVVYLYFVRKLVCHVYVSIRICAHVHASNIFGLYVIKYMCIVFSDIKSEVKPHETPILWQHFYQILNQDLCSYRWKISGSIFVCHVEMCS